MDKFVADQAEGLRRLLARQQTRVLAVTGAAPGAGSTSTVVNLAAALAQQGKEVLVLDESVAGISVSAMLGGLRGVAQAAAVVRGEIPLEQAVARHALGFALLAAPRHSLAASIDIALLSGNADIVLIDAQLGAHGTLSDLALQAHDVMLVTRVGAVAITETYACLKRLHYVHALAQFRLLANQVPRERDAQTAFDNLAGVAGRYLGITLEDAGHIPADAQMGRALTLSRCLVDAFPSTAAARALCQLAAALPHWPQRHALAAPAVEASASAVSVNAPPPLAQSFARHA
ncbi:MinD/ParA family ATP-binding protein [Paraburkholderia bonniea]|uniref:MinD/ParA family ATP-binding protein n=1 Tax=Paraburkholderia bonniea TaxID=2152891 RepID=UPI00129135C4|nr:P-loop NTPase [Paraburkholderia bonniea]